MSAHGSESDSYREHAGQQFSASAPVLRFEWSLSHVEGLHMSHRRHLAAALEHNEVHGQPQYSLVVVQAAFLLLAMLMSVATVASCFGWLRSNKRRDTQLDQAVGESNKDGHRNFPRPTSALEATTGTLNRPQNSQYFNLQPHSLGRSKPAAAAAQISHSDAMPVLTDNILALQPAILKSGSTYEGNGSTYDCPEGEQPAKEESNSVMYATATLALPPPTSSGTNRQCGASSSDMVASGSAVSTGFQNSASVGIQNSNSRGVELKVSSSESPCQLHSQSLQPQSGGQRSRGLIGRCNEEDSHLLPGENIPSLITPSTISVAPLSGRGGTSNLDSSYLAQGENSTVGAPTFYLPSQRGSKVPLAPHSSSSSYTDAQEVQEGTILDLAPPHANLRGPKSLDPVPGEHFHDTANAEESEMGEEEFVLMDESARLAPRNPQAPIASFPVWPPGIPDSPAGDSGLAANSRPSSPHAYVDRNGKLKSILDTATKHLGTLGQPSVRDLQKYLESLGNDNPVMQHFEMVGTNKMRCGAKSVVQFGRGIYDGYELVVRYFACEDAYRTAMDLYMRTPLSDLLPKLIASCDDPEGEKPCATAVGGLPPAPGASGVSGRSMPMDQRVPPCIAMEKGECLADYLDRTKSTRMLDEQQFGLRILVDVMSVVMKLHKAGYVHGNINPSHVLWLPSEASWTLIGLSHATRVGKLMHVQAGGGLMLSYASPELAVAIRATQEMNFMRGFKSMGQTGMFSAEATGALASDNGKDSGADTRGFSGGLTSGGFSFPLLGGFAQRAESGGPDGATEALSIADGVEAQAGVEMDVWAVGMLAWELLNGAPAFDMEEDDHEEVMEELCGIGALPWSDERISPEQRTKLGFFCEPVRKLLSRDPAQRTPLATFQALCNRVLYSSTSMADPSVMMDN